MRKKRRDVGGGWIGGWEGRKGVVFEEDCQRRLKVKYRCLDVSLNCYHSKKMATDGLRDFDK